MKLVLNYIERIHVYSFKIIETHIEFINKVVFRHNGKWFMEKPGTIWIFHSLFV